MTLVLAIDSNFLWFQHSFRGTIISFVVLVRLGSWRQRSSTRPNKPCARFQSCQLSHETTQSAMMKPFVSIKTTRLAATWNTGKGKFCFATGLSCRTHQDLLVLTQLVVTAFGTPSPARTTWFTQIILRSPSIHNSVRRHTSPRLYLHPGLLHPLYR